MSAKRVFYVLIFVITVNVFSELELETSELILLTQLTSHKAVINICQRKP